MYYVSIRTTIYELRDQVTALRHLLIITISFIKIKMYRRSECESRIYVEFINNNSFYDANLRPYYFTHWQKSEISNVLKIKYFQIIKSSLAARKILTREQGHCVATLQRVLRISGF